jgi:hypothetical protein
MRALVVVAVSIAACTARADAPLPPPGKVSVMSRSGRIRAISDPKAGTRVEDVKQHKVLWSLPGWHRSLFVADDGKHLVTQYEGLNLIPTDFTDDLVLLTFWREGRKLRDFRVRDFVPDHHPLKHTASHCYWGKVYGIDSQGRLRVERADGMIFLFDVSTGKTTEA